MVVKLDLLSCFEIRSSSSQEGQDRVVVERAGELLTLSTFELRYGDGIEHGDSVERLGSENRPDMLAWLNSIQ